MALISCPECGKQISNRALSCPHCGFPMQTLPAMSSAGTYDIELIAIGNNDEKIKTVRFLRETNGISLAEAVKTVDTLPRIIFTNLPKDMADKTSKTLKSFNNKIRIKQSTDIVDSDDDMNLISYFEEKDKPLTCPVCNSTNVVVGQRGFNIWTGFLGSNKTVNRCGKCGHTWTPTTRI